MRNNATTAARDTVLPAVRDVLHTARDKGSDLLDSNAAHEARRRGVAVVRAARGDAIVVPARRRWGFGIGMILTGTGLGLGLAWAARRFLATPEPYTHTVPTPSGTVTSEPSTNTRTLNEDVDLRAGMRTTM